MPLDETLNVVIGREKHGNRFTWLKLQGEKKSNDSTTRKKNKTDETSTIK
jgi:hypothetical protein